ncbi:MAG: Signal transduction histidine kinase CheA [Candidatus Sulfotelmatobacter sp.]|nr:Signal transduction histidine kinase CheA [Candidatus Sulfotelmatobacter sp.]
MVALTLGRTANLSLEFGNSDGSCSAYVLLNGILGLQFCDYQSGYQFGRLSVDLMERRNLYRFRPRVYLCFACTVIHWTQDLRGGIPWIGRAADAALEAGDFTHFAYSCNSLVALYLRSGSPLADVQHKAEEGLAFARKAKFGIGVNFIASQLLLIRSLRGLPIDFDLLDEPFDQREFEQQIERNQQTALSACWYWIRKMQERFFSADFPPAVTAAQNARKLLSTSAGFFETAEYHFYSALAHAAHFDVVAGPGQADCLEKLRAHHQQLTIWATNCEANFGDRAALVARKLLALKAAISGKPLLLPAKVSQQEKVSRVSSRLKRDPHECWG